MCLSLTGKKIPLSPQSCGWGRALETERRVWSCPGGDGFVPWGGGHLQKRASVPNNVADCSELPLCFLNRSKIRVNKNVSESNMTSWETWHSFQKKKLLNLTSHLTETWLLPSGTQPGGVQGQSWPPCPAQLHIAVVEEQEPGPGLKAEGVENRTDHQFDGYRD